jgi:hypothetical protein
LKEKRIDGNEFLRKRVMEVNNCFVVRSRLNTCKLLMVIIFINIVSGNEMHMQEDSKVHIPSDF